MAAVGASLKASQTQSVPSGVCKVPISAPRVADTSGVPSDSRSRPRPNWVTPNTPSRKSSPPLTDRGLAQGATINAHSKAESPTAGSMLTPGLRRISTSTSAIRIAMAKASRLPARWPPASPPEPAKPVMTATPVTAAAVAASVIRSSRSLSTSQAMPAVTKGIVASITMTSATLDSLKAFRKQTVASAEQSAITTPSRPMARVAATTRPLSRHDSMANRNAPANRPRQNSSVQASTSIRRV